MVVSIISFILGAIVFVIGFTINPSSAPQQTVQYLVYVCSSIFVASGLICIKLSSNNNDVISAINNALRTLEHKIDSKNS